MKGYKGKVHESLPEIDKKQTADIPTSSQKY